VIGGGTVGCLVAWFAARTARCDVELVDVNPNRESAARALGVRFALPERASVGAERVFHTSTSEAGLNLALRVAGFEATVVEMSWYGNRPVAVTLGEAFHSQRLTLKSSQVGVVAPSHRAEWDPRRRMELALSLLADPVLDSLITGESAFDELPAVMRTLSTSPGDTLCHRIRYGADAFSIPHS
jgi:threonine dehydrogenase-like Zn-dependent dehydrogenase